MRSCPNETYKAEIRTAIEEGVLTWAAFPFNSELSAYDRSLIEFGTCARRIYACTTTSTHQWDSP